MTDASEPGGGTATRLRGLVARTGRAVLPRLGLRLEGLGPGAVLLTRPSVDGDWIEEEKAVFRRLERRQLRALFDLYAVNCVLDVGAHKGNWARRLRRGGYTGRIVSFEPTPAALGRLRARAERDPDWQVRAVALGAEDGVTTMHVAPGTFSSLLQANRFGERRYAELQATEAITVPVRRLDGLLDELVAGIAEPRVYLKLDTQGFDVQVFAGLGDRAGDLVGMQSEVAVMPIYEGAPRLTEAVAVYEAAGFEIAAMWPVTRQRRTGRIVEYDCVLVRAKALPR